jgi:hypothetical protein
MFGRLPKQISAAAVQTCNQTGDALTVPLARLMQEVRVTQGITVLPRDASLVVIAQAQGQSRWNTAIRWIGAASGTVSTLSVLGIIKPNTLIGSWIIFGTAIIAVAGQQANSAHSTHSLLAITSESLPDPLQLPAAGCATGIVLVEHDSTQKNIDLSLNVPKVTK